MTRNFKLDANSKYKDQSVLEHSNKNARFSLRFCGWKNVWGHWETFKTQHITFCILCICPKMFPLRLYSKKAAKENYREVAVGRRQHAAKLSGWIETKCMSCTAWQDCDSRKQENFRLMPNNFLFKVHRKTQSPLECIKNKSWTARRIIFSEWRK